MRNPGHTSLGAAYRAISLASVTLAAGAASIASLYVDQNSIVIPQRTAVAGAPGTLAEAAVTPGNPGSFTVNSSNAGDTSAVTAYLFQGQSLGQKFQPLGNTAGGNIGSTVPGMISGTATLVAGSVVVSFATRPISNTGNLRAIIRHKTRAGTPGFLTYTIVGTDLTITSSNALDTSTVSYLLFNYNAIEGSASLGSAAGGMQWPSLQYRRVTLVAGTATQSTMMLPSTSKNGIILQRVATGGVLGFLTVGNVTAGNPGAVVVNSSDAGDTSVVDVFVFGGSMLA